MRGFVSVFLAERLFGRHMEADMEKAQMRRHCLRKFLGILESFELRYIIYTYCGQNHINCENVFKNTKYLEYTFFL